VVGTILLIACGLLLVVPTVVDLRSSGPDPASPTFAPSPLVTLPVNVYVPNHNNVSVINSSNLVTQTIQIKGKNPEPGPVAFCGNKIFVSDEGTDHISVISRAKGTVLKTIGGLISPGVLFCNSNVLWIQDSSFVRILNVSSYKILHTIKGSDAANFGYSPATKEVYVDNGNGSIFVYDPTTYKLVADLSGGPSYGAFAYDPIHKDMYLTNAAGYPTASIVLISSSNRVTQLNLSSNCAFSKALTGIAYSPATKRMYVSCLIDNDAEGTVIVLNASSNAVVTTIPVGVDTQSVAYDPSNLDVYVASPENTMGGSPGEVAVIGPADTVLASIPISADTLAIS
jgi:DNA-binding beta-propeller fold protein YncE